MLDESAHGRDARAGRDQDQRPGWIGGQVEVGRARADEAADVGAGDEVSEVVGRDAVVGAIGAGEGGGAEDVVGEGCGGGAVGAEGRGRDGVGAGF